MIPCRVGFGTMQRLTADQERNIYIHPNPLARDIFWQRIERLGRQIEELAKPIQRGLDFGGGSGSMVRFWSLWGGEIDLVDLDCGDASRLSSHFSARNLRVLQSDIAFHEVADPYDFVVAADVLEHFPDLALPARHIHRLLRQGGLLLISLPTENRLYELGRKLLRKTKPADHHHSSREVVAHLEGSGFHLIRREWAPRFAGLRLPLFEICVFRRAVNAAGGPQQCIEGGSG